MKKKKNIMVLVLNKEDKFFKYLDDESIKQYYKTSKSNFIIRILKKICNNIIIGNWKRNIKKVNQIIMFDNGFNEKITNFIKKRNKNAKIILWFWNPVNNISYNFLKCKYVDEFWSFDKADCDKYKIKYNSQFYTKNIKSVNKKVVKDVLFLGCAKDRKDELLKIKHNLDNKNIKTDIRIIENKNDYISYDEYLENVFAAKCLLDYNQNGQSGLTLRPMEALFLEKKLITNNKNIKNYDFYNPNNIFILGEDNIEEIKEFIDKPYIRINQDIIDYYDFTQWIKRFEV